ncbi:hypothetical protein ACIQWZ_36225 [Streptomyces sp. NPDC098077]|uniref:hypothetical protein n=1 Tax=Streptomyces sp. NPDC098077 TaxID=3366093 RepID=UPI0037FF44BD
MVVLDGLARLFDVTRLYFEPDDDVARQVYEGLQLMSAGKQGKVGRIRIRSRIRARGMGDGGLPPEVVEMMLDLGSELDRKASPHSNGCPRGAPCGGRGVDRVRALDRFLAQLRSGRALGAHAGPWLGSASACGVGYSV